MGRKIKEIFDKYSLSVIMSFIGVVFFGASFTVPPLGVIDPSVLTGIGELFGFTAAVSGISEYGKNYRAKYRNNSEEDS